MERGRTVQDLKRTVSSLLKMAPECQKLLLGNAMLQEHRRIDSYCLLDLPGMKQPYRLSIVLVFSLDQLFADLAAKRFEVRALQVLYSLNLEGNVDVIEAVIRLLEDRDQHDTYASLLALGVLAKAAEKDDERVLAVVKRIVAA